MFLKAINIVAPVKNIRIKVRTEPRMNGEILKAIQKRNDLYDTFRKNKDEQMFVNYKKQRNEVIQLIKKAKSSFFNEKIFENRNNSRKLWKTLKLVGYSNRVKTKSLNLNLDIGGKVISDKSEVANNLNNFFTTIANTLVKKLPSQLGLYDSVFLQSFYQGKGALADSFSLVKVSNDKILKMLKGLNPNKATGLDNIPARFILDAAEIISPCITHITNLSIEQSTFPVDFKRARVIPLYKKGSKLEQGNYRPVSILCCISKIIEKVVFEQVDSYLTTHNLLYEFQSGFRKSYSTDTCLLYLTDFIKKEIDEGNYCGMILLDLQKAFDTVNHDILLNKLMAMGFNKASIQWIQSYLGGRDQVVDVSGTLSKPLSLSCGVPQGSILGPLFFLLYINDMKAACDCNLLLYADDSALVVSHHNKDEVERTLSSELQKVSIWLAENKLSLHLGKTESILFGSCVKLRRSPGLNIKVGNTEILSKDTVSYLGCVLDSKMTGEGMATRVITKLNQKIKFLARITHFINREAMQILAGALVQGHFDYACISWYNNLPKILKNKLQTSQNKLIRLIHNVHARTHLLPCHFRSLKWLTVEDRVAYFNLNMVHRIINCETPVYLINYFNRVNGVHSYSTRRSSTDLVLYRFNTQLGKRSFLYSGAVLWNNLPDNIKNKVSNGAFKLAVKKWLFNKMA